MDFVNPKNYIRFFTERYLEKNDIPLKQVSFNEGGKLAVISMVGLFDSKKCNQGIRLMGYLNSLLRQFNAPLYQMQVVEDGNDSSYCGGQVVEIDFVFSKSDFDSVNQQIAAKLENNKKADA